MAQLDIPIASTNDDNWEESNGNPNHISGSPIPLEANSNYNIFLFRGVTIPQGATITAATIEVFHVSTTSGDRTFNIYAQDSDSPANLTASSGDVSNRPRTSAFTGWTKTWNNVGGVYETSPDISSAIQEVVDRAGFDEDKIAIIFVYSSGSLLRFRDYSQGSPAKLHVTYSAGGGGSVDINVSDNVTVTENITVLRKNLVLSVFDTINVSESITAKASPLYINVVDNIAVSESVVASEKLYINVSDQITVSESTTPQEVSYINVNDNVAVSEAVTVIEKNLIVSVNDLINVSEAITASLKSSVSVVDNNTVSESVTVSIISGVPDPAQVSVVDLITVAESVQTKASPLYINVFDTVNISESVAAEYVQPPLTVNLGNLLGRGVQIRNH